MTDEEHQKLCSYLRKTGGLEECAAANEIERLASELKFEEAENEHYVRLAFIDAGANPAVTWQQEAERLARENHVLKLGAEAWPEILKDRDERLGALAQSNAEPVKYEYRRHKGMGNWIECGKANYNANSEYEYRALYTAPPRPDASAGLIEAAEELADLMDDVVQGNYKPDTFTTQPLRKALRARAADKSFKND